MLKIFTTMFLVCGLFACDNSDSNRDEPIPDSTQFNSLRETIKSDLEENNAVAVSVAIYHQGEIVFAEAFGEKVKDGDEVVTPNTLFQLGSTTKMFTGLATLQLVDQGLLTTQDKFLSVLPETQYPGEQAMSWQDISIQHLLTNQSGLSDSYVGSDSESLLVDYMTFSYPQQNQQMNPPGLFYNYSNPNWSYLGAVVESLSQTPYADYMENNVFEPLGMQRTSVDRETIKSDGDYALGFQAFDKEMFLTDIDQIPSFPSSSPAGVETWSTPKEQLKMADFILNGNTDILSDPLRTEITARQIDRKFAGLPWYYGYGMFVDDGFMYNDEWYSERVWQHAGGTYGYTSLFWILPDKNIAISIMSSGHGDDFIESMVASVTALIDLPTAENLPFSPSNSSEYEKHVGTYNAGSVTVIVVQDGDELQITIPELDDGGVSYEKVLFPIGGSTFVAFIGNEESLVTFLPAIEGGESVYLRNRNLVGIKLGY